MRKLSPLVPLVCTACAFGEGDAKIPGEPLGAFQVVGELRTNDCGSGAMGSTDVWEFQIRLSRDLDQLFWLNGREVISGVLASDGRSFEFDTRVRVTVTQPKPGVPGCMLDRLDRASGKLGFDDGDEANVESFSGKLTFSYMPVPESDCTGLLGVEGGFTRLPCEMTYELDAEKLADD